MSGPGAGSPATWSGASTRRAGRPMNGAGAPADRAGRFPSEAGQAMGGVGQRQFSPAIRCAWAGGGPGAAAGPRPEATGTERSRQESKGRVGKRRRPDGVRGHRAGCIPQGRDYPGAEDEGPPQAPGPRAGQPPGPGSIRQVRLDPEWTRTAGPAALPAGSAAQRTREARLAGAIGWALSRMRLRNGSSSSCDASHCSSSSSVIPSISAEILSRIDLIIATASNFFSLLLI